MDSSERRLKCVKQDELSIRLAAAEMTATTVSANQQCANTVCFGPY